MLDVSNYEQSVSDYNDGWRLLDETLYRLCRENPGHARADQINAKLWIIGRTYATGIERKIATKGTQGSSMSQVAEHFLSNGNVIDGLLDELQSAAEILTPAKLFTIVSVHGRLVKLLSPITRNQQSTRSFTAKYLHFHFPSVPIYDSVAAGMIPSVVRWSSDLNVFEMPPDADEYYGWYVMRFFRLYQLIAEAKLSLKVKYLDNFLLSLAGSDETGVETVGTV